MLFSGTWLHPMSVPRGGAGKPNMTKMVRNAVIMTKIAMVMIWHRLRQETVAAPKVSTSLRIHTIARWVSSFERFQTMAGTKYLRQWLFRLFSTSKVPPLPISLSFAAFPSLHERCSSSRGVVRARIILPSCEIHQSLSKKKILETEIFLAYILQGGQKCEAGDGSVCDGRPICEKIQEGLQCTCFWDRVQTWL